jgi:hypothetical protein
LSGARFPAILLAMIPPEITSTSYRHWALPVLRALAALGGDAAPMKIENAIRQIPGLPFSDLQRARVIKGKVRAVGWH